jgi:tripartite-type tricarboxylate transporter receptor subunit TctC
MKLQRLLVLLSLVAMLGMGLPASAQLPAGWPAKPVMIVLPYTPGALDVSIRFYTGAITAARGWNFVLDYKPGGNGTIAGTTVLKAPNDGHTLLVTARTLVLAEVMVSKPPYDGFKDFTPVYQMTNTTQLIVVHPSVPARNLREYIAYAKANPGKINWGMIGTAAVQRLSGELLHKHAGVNVTFVPYKGSAPIMADVMAGNIQATMQSERTAGAPARAGKVRAIATSLKNSRSKAFPDLVSAAEQGVPDFSYSAWTGLHARAGTPESIIRALNAEFNRVTRNPDVMAKFEGIGEGLGGGTVEEFAAFLQSEHKTWVGLAKDLDIMLSGD